MQCDLQADQRSALCTSLSCAWKQKSNGQITLALHLSLLLPCGRRHHLFQLCKLQSISIVGQTQNTAPQNPLSRAIKYFGFLKQLLPTWRTCSQAGAKRSSTISYLTCSTLALCHGHDALERS